MRGKRLDQVGDILGGEKDQQPHAEGVLFPGLTIAVLAIVGAWRGNGSPEGLRYRNADPSRLPVAQAFRRAHGRERVALQIAGALWLAVVVALLLGLSIRLPGVKITSFARALAVGAIGALVLCGVSPRTRAAVRAWLTTPAGSSGLLAFASRKVSVNRPQHLNGRGQRLAAANPSGQRTALPIAATSGSPSQSRPSRLCASSSAAGPPTPPLPI